MKQYPDQKVSSSLIISIVLFATFMRIAIPGHIANFSPIDAIALFCGAYISRKSIAVGIALLSVWMGDLFLNKIIMGHWVLFYEGFYWQYASYVLITLIGARLALQVKPLSIGLYSLAAATLFFIISNFGVWASGYMYTKNIQGLIDCYIAGLPFFKNSLVSDLVFSMTLFGSMEWIHAKRKQIFIK